MQSFKGNTDSYTVQHSYVDEPFIARYVKFHTASWSRHPSMRVEIFGCQGTYTLHAHGARRRYSAIRQSVDLINYTWLCIHRPTCRPMSYGAIGQNKVNQRESLNLWYILRHIRLELILGPKGQKSFGSKVTERLTTPMLFRHRHGIYQHSPDDATICWLPRIPLYILHLWCGSSLTFWSRFLCIKLSMFLCESYAMHIDFYTILPIKI